MAMIDAGYFAKRVMARPEFVKAKNVAEICSASLCMSDGPDGWVEEWRHNWFGWFNSVEDAWSVVPEAERPGYRLFAYRIGPKRYRNGEMLDLVIPPDVHPTSIPSTFVSLGFDAVSKSREDVLGFECSPLSCNGMADELPVNSRCLFESEDAASASAAGFSRGDVEPGDYYVVEVLEGQQC